MPLTERGHLFTTCQTCQGRASAQRTIVGEWKRIWLHLDEDDWILNPHNVVPQSADRLKLAVLIREQMP